MEPLRSPYRNNPVEGAKTVEETYDRQKEGENSAYKWYTKGRRTPLINGSHVLVIEACSRERMHSLSKKVALGLSQQAYVGLDTCLTSIVLMAVQLMDQRLVEMPTMGAGLEPTPHGCVSE